MYEIRKLAVISGNQKQCFSSYLRSPNGTKSGNCSGYLCRTKAKKIVVIRDVQKWVLVVISGKKSVNYTGNYRQKIVVIDVFFATFTFTKSVLSLSWTLRECGPG